MPPSPVSVAPGVDGAHRHKRSLLLPRIGGNEDAAPPPPPRTPNGKSRGPAPHRSPPRWSHATDQQFVSKLSVAGRRSFLSWSANSPKAAAPTPATARGADDDDAAAENTRRRSRAM